MYPSQEIDIEGHRLAAALLQPHDSGIPVFFLHGIGGSIYFWTPEEAALFREIGPCYSLSLPGHFPAAFPPHFSPSALTAEGIARHLSRAMQEIVGERRALWVGHSTGGFAALCLGLYAPEAVAGIVSIAGFARGRWIGALGFNQWLVRRGPIGRALFKKVYRLGGLNRAVYRLFWRIYVHDPGALYRYPGFDAVIDGTFPCLQKLDLEAMATYFEVMPDLDITPHLSKINLPACVIVGDKDPIVPAGQSALIADKIPGSRLAVIPGCGHLPFFERPAAYRQAVESWLAEFRSLP